MLNVDTVYGHGFCTAGIAAIEAAGFAPRPEPSRFPGAQLSRFLDFEEGPSLELIEVEDEKAYVDFVPKGMKPYAPGVSLVIPDWADRDFPYFERRFGHLRPYRAHANYDGSLARGRPGADHLNFELPVLRDTFAWLTQYAEPRPHRARPPAHPNGARGVRGLVFDLDARKLERLAALVETEVVDGAVDVDGVLVSSRTSAGALPPIRRKIFPLLAVVVETAGLAGLPTGVAEGREARFGERPAVHVPTNDLCWDVILTGPWPPDARRRA